MLKQEEKVSVTMKGPLGAQKRKKNLKKIKSIENPEERVQKASRQMELNRRL